MNYGINLLKENILDFEYDKYYKEISLKLKEIKSKSKLENERISLRQDLSEKLKIKIDFDTLKDNFINILKDENSAQYLWLLYSKYEDNENYIDKISNTLKEENRVYRAGINLYKLNGWMTHSLYVYQISNYNVAQNIPIANYEGNRRVYEYVNELHEMYKKLSEAGKFILKVISLVHDIGVIENVPYHDKVGYKYAGQVLTEIGITDGNLKELNISFKDLEIIIGEVIKYHTIMSLLSGENSDECVETSFRQMLSDFPEVQVKKEIAKIMYIFTFADIIAVNEILMDEEKFQRLKSTYFFIEEIIQNKKHNRDKEKVALERICDMCGKPYNIVSGQIDKILEKYKIDKTQFMEDIYNVKWFHYAGPLMKTVNNLEISIRVFYAIIELIKILEGKEALKDYIITFEPSRPSIEYEFIEIFQNNKFFECAEVAKKSKENSTTYEKIVIENRIDEHGKHLNISILE